MQLFECFVWNVFDLLEVQVMVSNSFVSIVTRWCVHLFSCWLYWLVTQVSVCMEFGKIAAPSDIYTYSPHIIREAIKIIKHPQIFRHEDGCKQSKVCLYFFYSIQYFWIMWLPSTGSHIHATPSLLPPPLLLPPSWNTHTHTHTHTHILVQFLLLFSSLWRWWLKYTKKY